MKSSVFPDLMTSAAFILAAMFLIVSGRDRTGLRSTPDESEEFSQSYSLSSGATIEVRNIPFGPVAIERSATGSAQVHVIRTARSKDELACSRVTVDHTPTKLLIRGDDNCNCRNMTVPYPALNEACREHLCRSAELTIAPA